MNFFDQNSAPAISGNLANYTFRYLGNVATITREILKDTHVLFDFFVRA